MDKFAWMKALRGAEDLTHAEFRVLVILSTFTDASLGNAYPGLTKLTDLSKVNRKTTKAALQSLEEKGWIQLTAEGGNQHFRGKANVYRVTVPKGTSEYPPSPDEGAQSVDTRGPVSSTRGPVSGHEGDQSLAPHQYLDQPLTSIHEERSLLTLRNAGERTREEDPSNGFSELFGHAPSPAPQEREEDPEILEAEVIPDRTYEEPTPRSPMQLLEEIPEMRNLTDREQGIAQELTEEGIGHYDIAKAIRADRANRAKSRRRTA